MAEKIEGMAWVKGGISPNPKGRRKSVKTAKGVLQLFIMRNLKEKELVRLYKLLPALEQVKFAQWVYTTLVSRDTYLTEEEAEALVAKMRAEIKEAKINGNKQAI